MCAFIVCSLSDLDFIGCRRRGAPLWFGNQAIVRIFKSKHLCILFLMSQVAHRRLLGDLFSGP